MHLNGEGKAERKVVQTLNLLWKPWELVWICCKLVTQKVEHGGGSLVCTETDQNTEGRCPQIATDTCNDAAWKTALTKPLRKMVKNWTDKKNSLKSKCIACIIKSPFLWIHYISPLETVCCSVSRQNFWKWNYSLSIFEEHIFLEVASVKCGFSFLQDSACVTSWCKGFFYKFYALHPLIVGKGLVNVHKCLNFSFNTNTYFKNCPCKAP